MEDHGGDNGNPGDNGNLGENTRPGGVKLSVPGAALRKYLAAIEAKADAATAKADAATAKANAAMMKANKNEAELIKLRYGGAITFSPGRYRNN